MDALAPLPVAVVQWLPGADPGENRTRIRQLVREAASHGARLIVLPEYSQFLDDDLAVSAERVAEDMHGEFARSLVQLAGQTATVVVAGFIERSGEKTYNTVIAVDGEGVMAAYRKVHLYDAFGMRESDWLSGGSAEQTPVITVDGHRIGMLTCYDLRFPEVARRLVDAGADTLVVPAEWVRGPQKEHHWITLLTARAIESTVHVVAADVAPPIGAGCSRIIDPMGLTLASLGEQSDAIACADIDQARTQTVRERNPSIFGRKYRIIPGAPSRSVTDWHDARALAGQPQEDS